MNYTPDQFSTLFVKSHRLSTQALQNLYQAYKTNKVRKNSAAMQQLAKDVQNEIAYQNQLKTPPTKTPQQQKQNSNIEKRKKLYLRDLSITCSQDSAYSDARKQALQKTIDQNYTQYSQNYTTDAQVQAMLQIYGIDYHQVQKISGTALQHQLFSEVEHYYKKAAKVVFQHQIKNSVLISHVLALGQIATAATNTEILNIAMYCNDLADFMADTSWSICMGILKSTNNSLHMIFHPVQTAKQITKLLAPILRFLGGALTAYDNASPMHIHNMQIAQETFADDVKSFNHIATFAKQEFATWYETSSKQEKIEKFSELTADLLLQPKLIGLTAQKCWNFLNQVQELSAIERAMRLAEELGFENYVEIVEEIKLSPISIAETEPLLINLLETEIQKMAKNIPQKLPVWSESEAILIKESIENKIKTIMSDDLIEITQLAKQEQYLTINIANQSEIVMLDVEHLFIPKIICRWKYDPILDMRHCIDFALSGWHYKYLSEFENTGLIQILNKVVKNDCIYAEFILAEGQEIIKKTFVPDKWTRPKVIETIKQAVTHPYKIIPKGDNKILYSRLDSGIEILSYLQRKSTDSHWTIKTSFVSKDWILK